MAAKRPPKDGAQRLKGRPTIFNQELADYICEVVATNPDGIMRLCKKFPRMPNHDTIAQWRLKYPSFSERYLAAREQQVHLLFESAIDDVQSIENYEYTNPNNGATCVDPGIVAMKKAIANQKTHHASRIRPKDYAANKSEDTSNANDSLNKIKAIVNELNKVNESDV
jgi:hypothetical protein